jgi:hypothetical protein
VISDLINQVKGADDAETVLFHNLLEAITFRRLSVAAALRESELPDTPTYQGVFAKAVRAFLLLLDRRLRDVNQLAAGLLDVAGLHGLVSSLDLEVDLAADINAITRAILHHRGARVSRQAFALLSRVPHTREALEVLLQLVHQRLCDQVGSSYDQFIWQGCREGLMGSEAQRILKEAIESALSEPDPSADLPREHGQESEGRAESAERSTGPLDSDRVFAVKVVFDQLDPVERHLWHGRSRGRTWAELATELGLSEAEAQRRGQPVIDRLTRKLRDPRGE